MSFPYCNCNVCNGSGDVQSSYEQVGIEPEVAEHKSVYDRLEELYYKLEDASVSGDLLTELGGIIEDVDAIDDKINELKLKHDIVELGELSKKLY